VAQELQEQQESLVQLEPQEPLDLAVRDQQEILETLVRQEIRVRQALQVLLDLAARDQQDRQVTQEQPELQEQLELQVHAAQAQQVQLVPLE
jgi:hypothetical protein